MKKDEKIIQDLKKMYEAPRPVKKQQFIEKIEMPGISPGAFLRQQCGYIRKWNWVLAAVVFGAAVYGGGFLEKEILWILAAAVPFMAMSAVAEGSRAVRFGMEELELSTRFSLKATVMARMGAMGLFNLLVLGAMIPVLCLNQRFSIVLTGGIVLIPYLLTAFLNLHIVRKIRGRESIYVCMGITCLVSIIWLVLGNLPDQPLMLFDIRIWIAALFVLFILTGRECKNMLLQSEEIVWNLQ